jgi:DNA repair protein NreA
MKEGIRFEVVKKVGDVKFKLKSLNKISMLDSVSPPSVFIGSKLRYPQMNVGILSPIQRDEDAWIYDDAKFWADNDFEISDIVNLRESLLNSRFQARASSVRIKNKFLDIAKEIAIASNPVDVEIKLKRQVKVYREKDKITMPQALGAPLKQARITSNIKIDQKLDKVMNDEIKSSEGLNILYKNNFSEYTLSKILSIGALGLKKAKKLVPTRWSITATDDSLGKFLLENVRDYKWLEDYEMFFGEFMGNQYLIMLFPGVWSYELFELYYPGSSWNPSEVIKASTDFESYSGRKSYAFNTAGGYYASRLPIIEYLNSIKRQASVLVIRLETPSYWASLGVWVVRESVRKALNKGRMKFDSRNELIESSKKIAKVKFNFESDNILKQSKLLQQIKTQTSLREWF